MEDVPDAGGELSVPGGHAKGERCFATPGWPEGTLVGRMTGRAKLKWSNEWMAAGSEVSRLPAGRPIDFDGEVRFGFEARQVRPEEVGPGERPDGPPRASRTILVGS